MDALEDLEVWKRACRFSVSVLNMLAGCGHPVLRDQLARSSLSVPSNIAEGYERGLPRERIQFLRIAKGSCAEAWTQLLIGADANLLPRQAALVLAEEAKQIAKMTAGLIGYLKRATGQS
jgi:four helix bundle protein